MKLFLVILLIASLALAGYGYWGAFTAGGNKVYDELDAYYPFFMLITGVVLLITWLVIVIIRKRRTKKGKSSF
jgi:heme/copper-type cytochrome/quinol oxidase subunit 2